MIADIVFVLCLFWFFYHFIVVVPNRKADRLKEQIRKHEQANHNCRPKGAASGENIGNLRTCSVCGQKWRLTAASGLVGAQWNEVK